MLKHISVDICSLQEIGFGGKSVRMISGKAAEQKLFWIGNEEGLGGVEIFLPKEWVDKNIDIDRVSHRMIVISSKNYYFQ